MNVKALTVVSVCLMAVLAGCMNTSEMYRGRVVAAHQVVDFNSSGHQYGSWNTFDVTIDYDYIVTGDILEISISGELGQHYQMMYFWVKHFWLYLYLVDGDGVVVETVSLSPILRDIHDRFVFKRFLKVNDEIRGFSFGYRGHVYEFDSHSSFYLLPW